MNIERRHKVATLIAAIAGVRDPRFEYQGFEMEQLVAAVTQLAGPAELAMFALKLKRIHGVELSLDRYREAVFGGEEYLQSFRREYSKLVGWDEKSENLDINPNEFEDDLRYVQDVMSHIEVERNG